MDVLDVFVEVTELAEAEETLSWGRAAQTPANVARIDMTFILNAVSSYE